MTREQKRELQVGSVVQLASGQGPKMVVHGFYNVGTDDDKDHLSLTYFNAAGEITFTKLRFKTVNVVSMGHPYRGEE